MQREIFKVHAEVVDANGSYNPLSGYPKIVDSRSYGGDIQKAQLRAESEWHAALESMCKIDTRQLQTAFIVRASDGNQIALRVIGAIHDDPDPEV